MPNIQEYDNPIAAIRPDETGIEAMARSGRIIREDFREAGTAVGGAIGQVGSKIAENIEKHNTAAEISAGAAHLVTLQDKLTQDWNTQAKNVDPNDQTIGQTFREKTLQPAIQDWQDKFTTDGGKQWAAMQGAHLTQHLYEKTSADMATRSGDAMTVNLDILKNRASQAVYGDPTSLNMTLGLVDNSVKALVDNSPNLTGDQAAKAQTTLTQHIKTEIAKSAFMGMADKNPDLAEQALRGGQFGDYVDGTQAHQYLNMIKHTKEADARMARMEARQARQEAGEVASNKFFTLLTDPNKPGDYIQQMMKDPSIPPEKKPTLFHMAEAYGRTPEASTAPGLLNDFTTRLALPQDDVRFPSQEEVFKHVGKDMSNQDANFVLSRINPKDPNARADNMMLAGVMKEANQVLNPKQAAFGFAGTDPAGMHAQNRFETWFLPEYERQLKAGKTPQELLSPDSPNYLLKGNKLQQFAPSATDAVNGIRGLIAKPAEPSAVTAPTEGGITERMRRLKAILSGQPIARENVYDQGTP